MALRLPIGFSDFAQVRRGGYHYVDKTSMVEEILRIPTAVILLPRPRRFGKTLNLSMLRCWFERTDEPRDDLFEGLDVLRAGPQVAETYQRYPVIFLTFKDIKHGDWASCRAHLLRQLGDEVKRLRPAWATTLLADPFDDHDTQRLEAIAAGRASDTELQDTLRLLSRAVHRGTGQPAVLLIDEYDTPIHAAWSAGYYDQAIALFRNLLSAGLKDNAHLFRGVLTGILRLAKESIFSGLNNVSVYSLLDRPFARCFGFTEAEVTELCRLTGPAADLEGIRRWYNGYRMGDEVVYNPWSVVSYLGNLRDGFKAYWVNTASDELIRSLLIGRGLGVQAELTTLLGGGEIRTVIAENLQLRDLTHNAVTLWSFLLFCGYLNAREVTVNDGRTVVTLAIPNVEVLTSYRSLFLQWLELGVGGSSQVESFGRALLSGDEPSFRGYLQRLIVSSLSYHDLGGRSPEAVYQAFLVGLLVHLGASYVVDSNRESGFGRYDVCVRPRLSGQPGAVLELKVIDTDGGETAETALNAALSQVRQRDDAVSLRDSGATPIWLWGAVFDGKRVWARCERA